MKEDNKHQYYQDYIKDRNMVRKSAASYLVSSMDKPTCGVDGEVFSAVVELFIRLQE